MNVNECCWISCKRKSILIHLVETCWNLLKLVVRVYWRSVTIIVVRVCYELLTNLLTHDEDVLKLVEEFVIMLWKYVMNTLLTLEWYCEELYHSILWKFVMKLLWKFVMKLITVHNLLDHFSKIIWWSWICY